MKIAQVCTIEWKNIEEFMCDYKEVFAWSYDELKTYSTEVIKHKNPLKEQAKPFRKTQRHMNPKLAPIIQKELQKLFKVEIITHAYYSSWASNVVLVHKNDEIRICNISEI